jgi:2-methylcitrate dehydratase PrpD
MTSVTALMAEFFSELEPADVPDRVVHEAKRVVVDTLACLFAGADSEIGPVARGAAKLFGSGNAVQIAGEPGRSSLLAGVYANGRLANALDFDETFPVGAHFGVGAVAAALGMAQADRLTGREFLNCVVAGYELGGRVASYLGPVANIVDGGVTGFPDVWGVAAPVVMAAAGAAARARGFDAALFAQAIGLAASNAPLPVGAKWSSAIDLPNCKYCDAGWCAVTGVFGALSAERGSTGFTQILDGPDGLARMYGGSTDEQWLSKGLGVQWMLDDVTYKPWPTCRFTHYPLTALERILGEHAIAPEAIEEVVVETGPLAASERFTNPSPRTFAARQFSYPHMVAMRVLNVPAGPRWLAAEMVQHPQAEDLKRKIRIEPHARGHEFAASFVRNQIRTMPGGIRIKTKGRWYRAESDFALGDPWDEQTRFTDERLFAKARNLIGETKANLLIDRVMKLDRASDLDALSDVLAAQARETADA